jgi:peroxiredoxin
LAHSSGDLAVAPWVALAVISSILLLGAFARSASGEEEGNAVPPGDAAQIQKKDDAGNPSQPIAHPSKADCRVCAVRGSDHGREDVFAWREYEGHTYYFCSEACRDAFDADPAAYAAVTGPRPAPAVSMKFLDGTEVTLESMAGEVVLIDFWATWCKPCLKSMPEIQKLHDELSSSGFHAIGISIDESGDKKVRETVEKKKFTYPIAIDGQEAPAWEAFHVAAIPAMYLVGRDGMIAKQWVGKVDIEEVRRAAREAVAVQVKSID